MHNHESEHDSEKNISLAFVLNLLFSIIEVFGGIFTNSISILSDAFHDFGDAISLLIAVFCEKKSKKSPTEKYTYGYLRFSVLGGLITSVILAIGSVTIIYNCIPKLINPEPVNYDGMLVLAVVGIIINGIAAFKTHSTHNINERAVSLHMMEDVLGWVAVLIGSVIIKFTGLYIIDPILSIMITIYLLYHIARNFSEIGKLFLVTSPKDYKENELLKAVSEVEEVDSMHHIHVWSLDSENHYLTMHVVLKDMVDTKKLGDIKKKIKEEIEEHLKISHITIEFEFKGENCDETTCNVKHSHESHHHHH